MGKTVDGKRSPGIDFLRFVCAFLVVCIHADYRSKEYILPLTRTAVPVFFMLSGYFYSSVEKNHRQTKQIIKIIRLIVLSAAVYIIWDIVDAFLLTYQDVSLGLFWQFAGERLGYIFFKAPSLWINYLIFNEPPFSSHLWYLSAFLYVLLIVAVLDKLADRKKFYFLIPILLAGSLFLGSCSKAAFGLTVPFWIYRNFLFVGLPFFLLGDFLQGFEGRKNIRTKTLFVSLALSVLLIYAENTILVNINPDITGEFYLGTVLMAPALIILAERNYDICGHPLFKTLSAWGRRYALGIYISHMVLREAFLILDFRLSGSFAGMPSLSFLVTPVFLFTIDLMLLILWDKIKLRIFKKKI